MPRAAEKSLSNRTVNALVSDKDTVYWDRRLMGFGVRVYPTGAKVYVAQARGPDGPKRVRIGRHGLLNADEARQQAALIVSRIRAGEPPIPEPPANGPTVAEVAERFLRDYVAVRLKPSSARKLESVIRVHIVPAFGVRRLSSLKRSEVLALHRRLKDTPNQANRTVRTLSRMCALAEDWDLVPAGHNPCHGILKYPDVKRERFLSDTEYERLGRVLEAAEGRPGVSAVSLAAIRLLLLTGCRKNEILRLRWEEVDLKAGELRLADSKTGARVIALPEAAVRVLESLARTVDNPWVLPGRKAGRHLSNVNRAWHTLRRRAKLDDVRLHDLRHSYASRALALGESLPMIGKLLGHRRIQSTARYAHLAPDAAQASAERIARSVAGDLGLDWAHG